MKTELICAKKLLMVKGVEKYLVTTASGTQVWVNKDQFDSTAETITYQIHAIGSKYTDKNGAEVTRTAPYVEFIGADVQRVKKVSAVELYAELSKLGITPAINVG